LILVWVTCDVLIVEDVFWPGVSEHHQQNHGPLVLSASHTSTVAEELSAVLGVMQSLPRTRHIVTQFIINQLDSITHLISHTSPSAPVPTVSVCLFYSVPGPICWNGSPDYLKLPDLSFDCFKRQLKTFLFCVY